MNRFEIYYSEEAEADIDNLIDVITYQYKAPTTSFNYIKGIIKTIISLGHSAESYPVQTRKSLQQYGPYPRRINYKRMAIIYNAIGSTVIIRRIIPANTISGLGI